MQQNILPRIDPVSLPFTRDQLRTLQGLHTYFDFLLRGKMEDAADNIEATYTIRLQVALWQQVRRKINAKLEGTANRIRLKLPYPEAMNFFILLKEVPIEPEKVWLLKVRQDALNELHLYLLHPLPDPVAWQLQ